jgi:carbamoyl-phosphate synthase large subunit
MADVNTVMVIGSGPIVIGQGCEFDYSGTQAIRALRDEGIRVVLINSNPATIMTDPDMADATYVEPLTAGACRAILYREKVDAILPTLGGQTALNLAVELHRDGVLEELGVRMIGVDLDAIQRAEDRKQFKELAAEAGLDTPRSAVVHTLDEAVVVERQLGLPMIVRPSFTLGGSGSGMARTPEQFRQIVRDGLQKSPVTEVLLEESIEGWKEFELEVMRDRAGNHVVVCSIENIDPMGTHTGDSITVAPVQTLNDKDYQRMRNASFDIMDLVGIQGGANVQFALDPSNGRIVVIEMNPRVSRSSALASKATGYPIAKVAARLALGYTLDEIPNDIVGNIPAAFEPALDYVVVKVPRWNFEKFHGARDALGSQMQSIGEVMALGRTFNEALQKAKRSLESDWTGLDCHKSGSDAVGEMAGDVTAMLETPNSNRLFAVKAAFREGRTTQEIHELSKIDPWFLDNIRAIAGFENRIADTAFPCPRELLREAKRFGFSDGQLARLWGRPEQDIARLRERFGIRPVVKMVDTCAGEFAAATPYYYVAYDDDCELAPGGAAITGDRNRKVMILGSGPNRIGQGIEFDYCCVHAAMALREAGVESIMVNCNPETVSTDFDISDRLYFEPVSYEHVMAIVDKEKPDGVICQFGGQTPLKLIHRLHESGVRVLGTAVESIDRAEDRKRCSELLTSLGIKHPECAFASSREEAVEAAARIGYPVLLRPPYVLGGRAMELVGDELELLACVDDALETSGGGVLMLDKFIEGALEVDVDAVCDGTRVSVAGVMEHIEEAGIHSGDSSCVTPPLSLEEEIVDEIRTATAGIARALEVVGLLNVQFAVKDEKVYCLEINPRASRTVPFVSKATGVQWVKIATRACLGEALPEIDGPDLRHMSVKAPVLPFDKFPEVDTLLGPEMRSTGEVMGIGQTLDEAFVKAQMAVGLRLPPGSPVFFSVANRYKRKVIFPAKALHQMGYRLFTTKGMARVLSSHGVPSQVVPKISSGQSTIVDLIRDETVKLVINMAASRKAIEDGKEIRLAANKAQIPCITTMAGLNAIVLGLMSIQTGEIDVHSLQDYLYGAAHPAAREVAGINPREFRESDQTVGRGYRPEFGGDDRTVSEQPSVRR